MYSQLKINTIQEDGARHAVSLTEEGFILHREDGNNVPKSVLATNRSGLYEIQFHLFDSIQSARNTRSVLLKALHPISTVMLKLLHENEHALPTAVAVVPTSHHTLQADSTHTSISVVPSRSNKLEIKWMVPSEKDLAAKAKRATRARKEEAAREDEAHGNVEHHALHSVGDGMVQSTHSLSYSVDPDVVTLSTIEIEFPPGVRVTSVSGQDIASWRSVTPNATATPPTNASILKTPTSSAHGSLLRIKLRGSAMTDTVPLIVTTEQPFKQSADTIVIESPVCRKVLRQTGAFGVLKVANVELYEKAASGVAKAAATDIASQLRFQTDRPIIHAYKYITPRHQLTLSASYHEEIDVLEAIVDSAYYQALVVSDQTMHRLVLNLQNTGHSQYLSLGNMPSGAKIWSVLVNSVATKPSRAKDGKLMVPLLVGTGSNNDGTTQETSVEVVYLSRHAPLSESSGTLTLKVPSVDAPVSVFSAEVRVPKELETNFTGIQQVRQFSHPLPKIISYKTGKIVVEHGHRSILADTLEATGGAMNIKIPKGGTRHLFERLLLIDSSVNIGISYAMKVEKDELVRLQEKLAAASSGGDYTSAAELQKEIQKIKASRNQGSEDDPGDVTVQ